MNDSDFRRLLVQLQNGDEKLLDLIFLAHYEYCVSYLVKEFSSGKYYCSEADAIDLFMDALLKIRISLLNNQVENKNIRGYLLTICKRIWIKRKQRGLDASPLNIEKIEYYLGVKEGLYQQDFNPLLKKEIEDEQFREEQKRTDAFTKAWAKLSEPCQKLLTAFYIDQLKLKDLQLKLGYASYDTIKSMRRKCYVNLVKRKNDYYKQG